MDVEWLHHKLSRLQCKFFVNYLGQKIGYLRQMYTDEAERSYNKIDM